MEVGSAAVINVSVTTTLSLDVFGDMHGNKFPCAFIDISVEGAQEKPNMVGQQVIAPASVDARQASVYRGGHCEPLYVTVESQSFGKHSVVCVGPPRASLRSKGTPQSHRHRSSVLKQFACIEGTQSPGRIGACVVVIPVFEYWQNPSGAALRRN